MHGTRQVCSTTRYTDNLGGHMKELETLTFEEKEQLVLHLGRVYRKGRFQAALSFAGMVEDSAADDEDMEVASKIRMILRRMDRKLALILLNDYFEIKEGDWWKGQFSRSTYYRYKCAAMDLLLHGLYQEV